MELLFDIDGIRTPTRLSTGVRLARMASMHACPLIDKYRWRGKSHSVTKLNYKSYGETVFARVNNNISIMGRKSYTQNRKLGYFNEYKCLIMDHFVTKGLL